MNKKKCHYCGSAVITAKQHHALVWLVVATAYAMRNLTGKDSIMDIAYGMVEDKGESTTKFRAHRRSLQKLELVNVHGMPTMLGFEIACSFQLPGPCCIRCHRLRLTDLEQRLFIGVTDGRPIGEIAEELGTEYQNVHAKINVLITKGVLEKTGRGKYVITEAAAPLRDEVI